MMAVNILKCNKQTLYAYNWTSKYCFNDDINSSSVIKILDELFVLTKRIFTVL